MTEVLTMTETQPDSRSGQAEAHAGASSLLSSEQRFRTLIQDLRVGVLLQGPRAEILHSNQAALDLLGLSEDQLLGKTSLDPDWNVIHEDGTGYHLRCHPATADCGGPGGRAQLAGAACRGANRRAAGRQRRAGARRAPEGRARRCILSWACRRRFRSESTAR
jgi:PAS domain-containing protein